ncbi:MAG: hypothetical protein LC104_17290 [Bacteroidales bacterium]|nr:hypothetical protein [Bacteroidales bacterium]
MPKKAQPPDTPAVSGIVGMGLDNTDGEKRITRTEEMILLGGSAETHERMQETAIRFSEQLEKRGKKLQEASLPEVIDLLHAAHERTRG